MDVANIAEEEPTYGFDHQHLTYPRSESKQEALAHIDRDFAWCARKNTRHALAGRLLHIAGFLFNDGVLEDAIRDLEEAVTEAQK